MIRGQVRVRPLYVSITFLLLLTLLHECRKSAPAMKPFQVINNHTRRCMGVLLISCFFLSLIALAVHHDGTFIPLKNCAICKIKTSFSVTPSKVKIDQLHTALHANNFSEDIYLTSCWGEYAYQTPFVGSTLLNAYLNKAPPLFS